MNMKKLLQSTVIALLALTSIILIGLQITFWGWLLLLIGAFLLLFCPRQFRRDFLLVYVCLAILGITPITTDIRIPHMLYMGTLLSLAIIIPYTVSRYIYKNHLVTFRFHHGRKWFKSEIFYIFLTAVITYFLFPFMLRETGSYLNWTIEPGVGNLIILFIGTNALGIWDELFFVNTILGILRKYLSFPIANLTQSILFTSFLYELGFRGWAFLVVFGFALLQGYIYTKTESLFYVITIHLVADLILYLALIYLHHPAWLPIFVT